MRSEIRGLLFDIDETLTTDGKLTRSLCRHGAPEARRPAGGADYRPPGRLVRSHRTMWPVDAVVARTARSISASRPGNSTSASRTATTSAAHRSRLEAIGARILEQSARQRARFDQATRNGLAIDYCEDVTPLPLKTAERIAGLCARKA